MRDETKLAKALVVCEKEEISGSSTMRETSTGRQASPAAIGETVIADALSPSLLKSLLNEEGGAAE